MSVLIFHVWMDTDIDQYEYTTLSDPRPIQSFENLDIKKIDSLYHFFEVFNIEKMDNGREIFEDLVIDYKKGRLTAI